LVIHLARPFLVRAAILLFSTSQCLWLSRKFLSWSQRDDGDSSKQNKIGSNRNKRKQDLFRLCFGLFRETKTKKICLFRFVSVFRTYIETPKQTELFLNKPKQTETTLNFLKKKTKYALYQTVSRLLFCLFRFNRNTKTLCFVIEAKQQKQTFCFG
jgi:hypothetical protein